MPLRLVARARRPPSRVSTSSGPRPGERASRCRRASAARATSSSCAAVTAAPMRGGLRASRRRARRWAGRCRRARSVTRSSGSPSRSAACCVCTVAVPMPISCAGHLHHGAPVRGEPDARGPARHAVVGIGGGRARPCRPATRRRAARRASDRAGPSRSAPRRRGRPSTRWREENGVPRGRILLGLDPAAQLDRVERHRDAPARRSRIRARTCRSTRPAPA